MKFITEGSLYLLVVIATLFFWQSCAKPSTLGGGPEDKSPPAVNSEKSSPNHQTNFSDKEVELHFDEYISLKNLSQIIVSPPLDYNPKIISRGKKVIFAFDEREELKEDATYVINFGDAIVDFNASNKLPNYRFVFSTGDFIDSLSISGFVKDALSREPVEDVLVMLYDTYEDSIVYKEKPFYFARTDNGGRFKIENLRADTFKVFALLETNLNYIYDQPSEMVGYLDSLIMLTDTSENMLDLEIFTEVTAFKKLGTQSKTYGVVAIGYSDTPDKVNVVSDIENQLLLTEVLDDSLKVWYRNEIDTSFQLFLDDGIDYVDTVKVRKSSLVSYKQKRKRLALKNSNLESGNVLAPFDSLALNFTYPIGTVNTDSISIRDTSGMELEFDYLLDSLQPRELTLVYDSKPDSAYTLDIFPGGVIDIFDLSIDSTGLEYTVARQEDYGTIHFAYDSLDVNLQYVVQLKDGDEVVRESVINVAEGKITFPNLLPQQYDCEILLDENKNGKWDPGNYLAKSKSEVVIMTSIESLRANWELNIFFINNEFREDPANE